MTRKQEEATKEPKRGRSGKRPVATKLPITRVATPARRAQLPQPVWPLSAWEDEVDRLFNHFRSRFPSALFGREKWPVQPFKFAPAVDLYETDKEVMVRAEVPGLSKDDIELELTPSTLTVAGEKKQEETVKQQDYYYHYERSFGAFVRRIELPTAVKIEEATASLKDGVLEVRLPKSEETTRKVVKVEGR